jgi:LysR family transcriptional activator of glutamate synthase operon
MMQLHQLEALARVVAEENFTRAGEALGFSQPAISRQIAALERELDVKLIERGRGAFRLTPAGRIVLDETTQILVRLDRLRQRVAELTHPRQGIVAVACVTTVGLHTLPALIRDFSLRYPDVKLRLWSGRQDGVVERVLDGVSDVGLVSTAVIDPRLRALPLFEDPVVAVATPGFAAALPDPLPLEQFAQQDLILFESPSRFRTIVDAALQQAGVIPTIAMEFDSHEAVRAAAHLGRGIAIVPQQAVPDDLQTGGLVKLNVEGFPRVSRTTSLIFRKDESFRLPALENFLWLVIARYTAGVWRRGDPTL